MSENDFSRWGADGQLVKKDPCIPIFEVKTEQNGARSREAGRPMYDEIEYVTILLPGIRNTRAFERVTDIHRERWPREYQAFKEGRELPIEGTLLADWPNSALNRARVEELAYFNIKTVEQLAIVNDAQLGNLGMGARELRAAAEKFLEVSRGVGALERLVLENLAMKDEIDRLKRELTEANGLLNAYRDKERLHASA